MIANTNNNNEVMIENVNKIKYNEQYFVWKNAYTSYNIDNIRSDLYHFPHITVNILI